MVQAQSRQQRVTVGFVIAQPAMTDPALLGRTICTESAAHGQYHLNSGWALVEGWRWQPAGDVLG